MEEKLVVIGQFGAPHGVRGEIRVTPMTDFPNRFDGLKTVYLDENTSLTLDRTQYHGRQVLCKVRGVDDRDAADQLKGRLLKVRRSDVPPLGEGEYYQFDIVGLKVYDERAQLLGTVEEILVTGSNDVYVVRGDGKEYLVPALKSVVQEISLETSCMRIKLPEMAE